MKKVCMIIVVCLPLFFLIGCGSDGIVGTWISDYDDASKIVFRNDGTMTVTTDTQGTTIDGIYETDGDQITIKLFADGFTDSITAIYKIENNKLQLTKLDGQIEQFSRK